MPARETVILPRSFSTSLRDGVAWALGFRQPGAAGDAPAAKCGVTAPDTAGGTGVIVVKEGCAVQEVIVSAGSRARCCRHGIALAPRRRVQAHPNWGAPELLHARLAGGPAGAYHTQSAHREFMNPHLVAILYESRWKERKQACRPFRHLLVCSPPNNQSQGWRWLRRQDPTRWAGRRGLGALCSKSTRRLGNFRHQKKSLSKSSARAYHQPSQRLPTSRATAKSKG